MNGRESRVDRVDRGTREGYPFFMNYLAHAFLSPPSEEILLGNLACDMIRPGDTEYLSPRIRAGMELHQRIDRFTDAHESFKKLRAFLSAKGFPYAGVLVDIICDHFLALRWDTYSEESLHDFAVRVYAVLSRTAGSIPGSFPRLAGHLCREDWFGEFNTETGLENALFRVNYRSSRDIPVQEVMRFLREIRKDFEREFQILMSDLTEGFKSEITEYSE